MSNTRHATNPTAAMEAAASTEPPQGRADAFTVDGTVLTYETTGGDEITFDLNLPLDDIMSIAETDQSDPKAMMEVLRDLLGDEVRKLRLLDFAPFFERFTWEVGRIAAVGLGE